MPGGLPQFMSGQLPSSIPETPLPRDPGPHLEKPVPFPPFLPPLSPPLPDQGTNGTNAPPPLLVHSLGPWPFPLQTVHGVPPCPLAPFPLPHPSLCAPTRHNYNIVDLQFWVLPCLCPCPCRKGRGRGRQLPRMHQTLVGKQEQHLGSMDQGSEAMGQSNDRLEAK